jgi:hypothetical protein
MYKKRVVNLCIIQVNLTVLFAKLIRPLRKKRKLCGTLHSLLKNDTAILMKKS